jgi:hypothetical protein
LPQATRVKATAATATAVRGVLREDKFIENSMVKKFDSNKQTNNLM